MPILTLEEAKLHLRITDNSENSLIQLYIAAAQERIINFLNQDIPGSDDSPPFIPSSIRCAALLIVGDLYENREAQANGGEYKANPAVDSLLFPYRVNMGI